MLKRIAIAVVVLVVILVVVQAATVAYIRSQASDIRHQRREAMKEDLDRALPLIKEDQAALRDTWLVKPHDGPDASVVFKDKIVWPQGERDHTRAGVSEEIATAVKVDDWEKNADTIDLTGVDLAWMKELPRYGFWDLEVEGSPLDPARVEQWVIWSAPMPDYMPLITVAKVRLLLGIKNNDMANAVAEVRALARLTATTENLIGAMIATSILQSHNKALDQAAATGIDVAGIEPFPRELVQRYKRVVWAAPDAFTADPLIPGLEPEIVVGRCVGMQEALGTLAMLRGFLASDYQERIAELTAQLHNAPECRLKNLRASWEQMTLKTTAEQIRVLCAVGDIDINDDFVCQGAHVLSRMPFVRSAIGEILLSIGQPEWYVEYSKTEKTP